MSINRERKISTCYKKEIGGRGNDSAMVERGDKVMPMMLMATTWMTKCNMRAWDENALYDEDECKMTRGTNTI